MRFRGMSITMVGVASLLLMLAAPEADAQRGRVGVLRPAPRPQVGVGGRPRLAAIRPHFLNSCFFVPWSPFFPFFGGFGGAPFVNVQVFADAQPSPDPGSHITPNPGTQPVPHPLSHALPNMQPAPQTVVTNVSGAPVYTAPVYSTPVYGAPVYAPAAPVAMPHASGGMVVGDVIVDPTFGLWGSSFFFGGGLVCAPHRSVGTTIIIR